MHEECASSDETVWRRIGCILSYGGSVEFCIVNYALLLLNVGCCWNILFSAASTYDSPRVCNARRRQVAAAGSLVFVIVFQIVLCLAVKCSGISIIWCACLGWICYEQRQQLNFIRPNAPVSDATTEDSVSLIEQQRRKRGLFPLGLVIVIDLVAIIYYAITLEPITTVAHICAILLGIVLSQVSSRWYGKEEKDDTAQVPSQGTPHESSRLNESSSQLLQAEESLNR